MSVAKYAESGQCAVASTYVDGGQVTAANLNANLLQAAVTNSTLACVDGDSASVAVMQQTVSPGAVGSESLATSAQGEIERIRFILARISGQTQWYGATGQNQIQFPPYGTAAGNTSEIRFLQLAAGGTNYVGFKAPDSIASSKVWVLPSADSTGTQCITSNGSTVLSFSGCLSGSWITTNATNQTISMAGSSTATSPTEVTGQFTYTGTGGALLGAIVGVNGLGIDSASSGNHNLAVVGLRGDANITTNHNLTTTVSLRGVSGFVSNTGTGIITGSAGIYSGAPANSAGPGTITSYYGYYGEIVSASGTITNAYGMYINTPTGGGTLNIPLFIAGTGVIQLGVTTQAALGSPANGSLVFCSDCNTATACTAGGTGALASRQAGAWKCL